MPRRTIGSALGGLALVGALAGCGPAVTNGSASAATPATASAAASTTDGSSPVDSTASTAQAPLADTSGLVVARHAQCDQGAAILRYLATGDSGGDPGMDQVFAGYVGVSPPQARALADKWITGCDQQVASQAAAASSSAARAAADARAAASWAAASASQAQHDAQVRAQQQRSCAAIGGQSDGSRCQSTSQGTATNDPGYPCSAVYVEFTGEGTIDPTSFHNVNTDHPGCFR